MSDVRWGDPREDSERDRDHGRPRVYDDRDRNDHDPRDGLMHDLDLPHGEERELVVDRDRVYELNGEDSRTLAAVGAFRVVPEHDLDIDHGTLDHLRDEGLVDVVDRSFVRAKSTAVGQDSGVVQVCRSATRRSTPCCGTSCTSASWTSLGTASSASAETSTL